MEEENQHREHREHKQPTEEVAIRELMNIVDDHKESFSTAMYLKMCDIIKKIHQNIESSNEHDNDNDNGTGTGVDNMEVDTDTLQELGRVLVVQVNINKCVYIFHRYKYIIFSLYIILSFYFFNIVAKVVRDFILCCIIGIHYGLISTVTLICLKSIIYNIQISFRNVSRALGIFVYQHND